MGTTGNAAHREPWNKVRIVGQKVPFKLKDIWALRMRLQMESRVREFALFNWVIDSKLRGCDLVALKVRDVCHGDQVATRAVVMHHKTQRPVLGPDRAEYGTYSMRRTEATLTYRRAKNLRAVQLLLGHSKPESTVRYLGGPAKGSLQRVDRLPVPMCAERVRRRTADNPHA